MNKLKTIDELAVFLTDNYNATISGMSDLGICTDSILISAKSSDFDKILDLKSNNFISKFQDSENQEESPLVIISRDHEDDVVSVDENGVPSICEDLVVQYPHINLIRIADEAYDRYEEVSRRTLKAMSYMMKNADMKKSLPMNMNINSIHQAIFQNINALWVLENRP